MIISKRNPSQEIDHEFSIGRHKLGMPYHIKLYTINLIWSEQIGYCRCKLASATHTLNKWGRIY